MTLLSPARRALLLLLSAVLLASGLSLPFEQAAAQTTGSSNLTVALVGFFDRADETQTGIIAGTVAPESAAGAPAAARARIPFTFTAGCVGAPACTASGSTTTFDFGDGSPVEVKTGTLTATHFYTRPGRYVVTARVGSGTGSGQARMLALVSPRFADVDVHDAYGVAGRSDRSAIWAVSALGIMGGCRTAEEGTNPEQRFESGAFPQQTQVNRPMFCPRPSNTFGPVPINSLVMPGSAVNNGITGQNCLERWENCGLPAATFAGTNGGNPRAECGLVCENSLRAANLIDPGDRLIYDPRNCLDGFTAQLRNGVWRSTAGVEFGCVSREEFYSSINRALDGSNAGNPALATKSPSPCVDINASAVLTTGQRAMLRSAQLGLPITHTRNGGEYCDPTAVVTKGEAYRALGIAIGAPGNCPTSLRDLQDATLGHGTRQPNVQCPQIGALLREGSPLVGESACADEVPSCFIPEEGLTRADAAILFASTIAATGRLAAASGLLVSVTPSATTVGVADPVNVNVEVRTPVSYPATATATLAWTVSPTSSVTCTGGNTATVGSDRVVNFACRYERTTPGTEIVRLLVTDSQGGSATRDFSITVTNAEPRLGPENFAQGKEGQTLTLTVAASDLDTPNLTYQVAPAITGPWGTSAAVNGIGVVSVAASNGNRNVELRYTPNNSNTYGTYRFALRACDPVSCATREMEGNIQAQNDAPVANSVQAVGSKRSEFLEVTLGASDASDVGRPGYPRPDFPITRFTFEAVPETGALGRLMYAPNNDNQFVPVPVGATLTTPGDLRVRFYPSGNGTAGTGAPGDNPPYVFVYSATDAGFAEPDNTQLSSGGATGTFIITN